MLVRHRSAFAAVAAAGLLVALAASSGPLATTAAASSALKDELVDLTPFGTGLQITGLDTTHEDVAQSLRRAARREQAVRSLGSRLGLEQPVFTTETELPLTVATSGGDVPLNLLARTDVLHHVEILRQTSGPGVYISDFTARIARAHPGGTIALAFSGQNGGDSRKVAVRVKGIYRTLDATTPGPYWVHFLREIFPPGVDPPPPVRYVLVTPDQLYRIVNQLSTVRTVKARGRVYQFGDSPPVGTMAELAVDPKGLTIARARALSRSFTRLRHELRASALGRALGCTGPAPFVRPGTGNVPRCRVGSSIASAVVIADRNVSEISPVVTLLSGAAAAIALAFAGAAGIFLVRRRSAEAALLYRRGERTSTFALRTGLELLLPLAVGAAAGFGRRSGRRACSRRRGRSTPTPSAGRSAAPRSARWRLPPRRFRVGDSVPPPVRLGGPRPPVASQDPVGAAAPRCRRVASLRPPLGGGLAGPASGAGHPTLAVFLFPLLLVAGVAGLVVRALRPALRLGSGRSAGLPTAVFLALRRLAAAGAVLTALLVVTAVAFGSYFYSEAVASSLSRGVSEKAYVAYGGDAQGLISGSATLPKSFPYPLTRLDYGNQAAVVGGPDGTYADVLAVDGATLGSVHALVPGWGADPRPLLPSLGQVEGGRLPVVVSDAVPADTKAIWLQGARLPVRVVARVHVFPGMSEGVPVVVADRSALGATARKTGIFDSLSDPLTYVWAKGPPAAVARALEAPPVEAAFVSSVDAFRKQPDVLAATRAFSYMRLMAARLGRARVPRPRALPGSEAALAGGRVVARRANGARAEHRDPLARDRARRGRARRGRRRRDRGGGRRKPRRRTHRPVARVPAGAGARDPARRRSSRAPWRWSRSPSPRARSPAGPPGARTWRRRSVSSDTIVACRGLSKTYLTSTGGIEALHSVDAELAAGKVTAIVGASGSGKSTLLRAVAGLDRPTSGSLLVGGREPAGASSAELRRHRAETVTYVSQKPADNFIPHLTLAEHATDEPEIARALLADVGLAHRLDRRPVELSGGEQARAAFALAVGRGTQLVVVDEPTAELDGESAHLLLDAIRRHAGGGIAFVVATHDPDVTAVADRLCASSAAAWSQEPRRARAARPAGAIRGRTPALEARALAKTFPHGGERRSTRVDATLALRPASSASCSAARARASRPCSRCSPAGNDPTRVRSRLGGAVGLGLVQLGYLPQRFGLIPELSVRENVELPARLTGRRDELAPRVDELLARPRARRARPPAPAETSIGQQQRTALARALVLRPPS